MLFSSLTFLFIFLPLVLLFYIPGKQRWKNGTLLFFSLVFYAWGGVSLSAVLVLSILMNHLIGTQVRQKKRSWLVVGIVLNVTLLFTYKYLNFLIENIGLLGQQFDPAFRLQPLRIILPLGISFFTFHSISFLLDIYRKEETTRLRLADTALYICFFPQLVAGPIIRYHQIIGQIRERSVTLLKVNLGIQRFIVGLFKKVVLANSLGIIADAVMGADPDTLHPSAAWLGILAYTLQIYYDFSGYSDMAIGLGHLFGFDIPENFNYPYISRSIQDFWRRWHISLSSWFRDYVYIPLGGNRKGPARTYLNLSIVFLLTGFWHGATWNFVFWGAFHGFFLILERLFLGKLLEKLPRLVQWAYMLLIVLIGWIFFRLEDFGAAFQYIGILFSAAGPGAVTWNEFLDTEKIWMLSISLLFIGPVYGYIQHRLIKLPQPVRSFSSFAQVNMLLPLLFLYAVMLLCGSSYNPFIYFRF
jgi:alginate O-acetyltransferase complex protein AlgI